MKKYYNIEDKTIWTEKDMQELYEAYIKNSITDEDWLYNMLYRGYEDWLDDMLDQSYEEIEDFDKYSFQQTDSWEFNDRHEHYFEIESDENLKAFMKDYHIDLAIFDTSDADPSASFSGLEFQLSVYPDGSYSLEFGPVFSDEDESFTTVGITMCSINGLAEYLLSEVERSEK